MKKLLRTIVESKQKIVIIDGFKVRNSDKYAFFLKQGLRCKKCGKRVAYVVVSRENKGKSGLYHLSFYLEDDTLLTIDHIIPKSRGGINDFSNYQALCEVCNMEKGATIEKF